MPRTHFENALLLRGLHDRPITSSIQAPEVGLGQKYNQSCDIYSFGLIFWEMLTLRRPFPEQRKLVQFKENVWEPWGRQVRPPIPTTKLTPDVQSILTQCWDFNPRSRPKAPDLLESLKKECLELREDMTFNHKARRSTFVLSSRGGSAKQRQSFARKMREEFQQQSSRTIASTTKHESSSFLLDTMDDTW